MKFCRVMLTTAGVVAFALNANALLINDPGVVGSIEAGTQSADVDNVTEWANFLLDLAANRITTTDGNVPPDNTTENYETSSTDYVGTLAGGVRVNGATPDITAYTWVVGKYDGQNAGYVVFNVADYLAAAAPGTTTIPEFSYSIWGTSPDQYQLSNITGYGQVPDGGLTAIILGIACLGLHGFRRLGA